MAYPYVMPTYTKRKNSWRVQICCNGIRESRTFPLKGQAQAWAENREHEIRTGKARWVRNHLLDDALVRYRDEIAPKHRGYKWERNRIDALRRRTIAGKPIKSISPSDLSDYRESRLAAVKNSTVNREMALLGSVFSTAVKLWGWLDENPCKKLPRLKNPPPRNRRISEGEVAQICAELKTYTEQTVAILFRLALQTAMRQGELCRIRAQHFHGAYVHLPETKNGEPRDVPLTPSAQELLKEYLKRRPIAPNTCSRLFAEAVKRTGIKDLTFHDSRHEAAVFLAGKLSVMDLAKVGGWKDVKILLNTYYSPTPADLAAKLAL